MQVGDTPIFRRTIKDQDGTVVDISAATTLELRFRRRGQAVSVKLATLTGDGTDGQMEWDSSAEPGFLTLGPWRWQAKVVIPAGTFWSNVLEFTVEPNLEV